MLAELRNLFFTYAPWIVLIPAGLVLLKRNKAAELRPLMYYLLLSVVTQIASFILWKSSINNMPILHVYTLFEFIVLFWFFALVFRGTIPKMLLLSVAILFCTFSIVDSLYIEPIYQFNTISRSVEALLFIFLSVMWLVHNIAMDESGALPNRSGANYIIAGLFVYFSGSVVLFSFSNDINRMAFSLSLNIWSLHTLLLVIMYLAMTIGLLKYKPV